MCDFCTLRSRRRCRWWWLPNRRSASSLPSGLEPALQEPSLWESRQNIKCFHCTWKIVTLWKRQQLEMCRMIECTDPCISGKTWNALWVKLRINHREVYVEVGLGCRHINVVKDSRGVRLECARKMVRPHTAWEWDFLFERSCVLYCHAACWAFSDFCMKHPLRHFTTKMRYTLFMFL